MTVPTRERLPNERAAATRKIRIGQAKVYVTVGRYEDGRPGELFLWLRGAPSVNDTHEALVEHATSLSVSVSRFVDAVAVAVSIGLQYGIPLDVFCEKFERTRFDPAGSTGEQAFGIASSPLDAVFRRLRGRK